MELICDLCGVGVLTRTIKTEWFPYGRVVLQAQVPVFTCAVCEEAYTGAEAEEARDQAVQDYLHSTS